jgi:hypothetical protein
MAGTTISVAPPGPTIAGSESATSAMPAAPFCTRETVTMRPSPRSIQRSSVAVTRPIAWLVAPLRRMIS